MCACVEVVVAFIFLDVPGISWAASLTFRCGIKEQESARRKAPTANRREEFLTSWHFCPLSQRPAER